MTWNDILAVINTMTDDQKASQASVFPPVGCPTSEMVPVTGIEFVEGLDRRVGYKKPIISTGKPYKPGPPI